MTREFVSSIRGCKPAKSLLAVLAIFFTGQEAFAADAWYWGTVTQITTYKADGSFIVYLNNPTIQSDCLWERVRFSVADMGAERTKAALSMALAAYTAGKEWGVIVDISTPGLECKASSTATAGAGIKD